MSEEQIRTLHRSGMIDFGSHSVHHLSMSNLSVQAMKSQAVDSKLRLEALLGHSIHMFSYPYGQLDDISGNTIKVLAEAGYDIAVTTHWGTLQAREDLLRLRRITLRDNDTCEDMKGKIEGQYDWIALKERVGFGLRTIRRKLYFDFTMKG